MGKETIEDVMGTQATSPPPMTGTNARQGEDAAAAIGEAGKATLEEAVAAGDPAGRSTAAGAGAAIKANRREKNTTERQ